MPVFLIAGSVRVVINAPALYSYGFDRYDIPAYTGIERDDLLEVAARIRAYFNDDSEYLIVPTTVRGVDVPSLYNEREILHMRDVKGLVRASTRCTRQRGCTCWRSARSGSRSTGGPSWRGWRGTPATAAA